RPAAEQRNAGSGAQDHQYGTVSAALIWTLDKGLGDAFTRKRGSHGRRSNTLAVLMKSASRRTAAQERTGGTSDPKRKQTGPSAKPGGAVYGVPGMPTTQAVLGRAHGQVMATKWRDRAVSPEHAVRGIRRGDRVFVGSACATPRTLLRALEAEASPPAGVHLVHSLTDGAVLDRDGRARTSFRHCAFYLGRDMLNLTPSDRIAYVP